MDKVIGYEKCLSAELVDGSRYPWFYRIEEHPKNAEGFRTVRITIDKEEYDKNI